MLEDKHIELTIFYEI